MIAILVLVVAVTTMIVVVRGRLRWLTVRGASMSPTYLDGDRLLVWRSARPKTGSPLVFEVPSHGQDRSRGVPADVDWLVKRVVATAGQRVPDDLLRWGARVPPGHFAVLGDNPRSLDSRHFGFVPDGAALGRVLRAYRPERPES